MNSVDESFLLGPQIPGQVSNFSNLITRVPLCSLAMGVHEPQALFWECRIPLAVRHLPVDGTHDGS